MQTGIYEPCKDKQVTQSELADAADVTRQTIISLENGRYKASLVMGTVFLLSHMTAYRFYNSKM